MARTPMSPQLRDIARQLEIALVRGVDPTAKIVDACVLKVRSWIEALGPAETFGDLIEIVAAKLKVHFEVIRSDQDLQRVVDDYLRAGETGFIDLKRELDGSADAVVIRLQRAPTWSDRQFIAVIDARGAKASKEWFSKWHELAHLIAEPQTKFAFRRTLATRRDPVERVMDQIAAELAFYPDILLPAVDIRGLDLKQPSLKELVDFHGAVLSFSSLHSSLIALLRHSAAPAILIEAKVCLKASEREASRQPRLFPEAPPEPLLRAFTTAHNTEAVRRKLYVHRWLRVPERSVIYRVFNGDAAMEHTPTTESLAWWESQGRGLAAQQVVVEAMSAGSGRVLALVTKAPPG